MITNITDCLDLLFEFVIDEKNYVHGMTKGNTLCTKYHYNGYTYYITLNCDNHKQCAFVKKHVLV